MLLEQGLLVFLNEVTVSFCFLSIPSESMFYLAILRLFADYLSLCLILEIFESGVYLIAAHHNQIAV
jgi:hypothetical protein